MSPLNTEKIVSIIENAPETTHPIILNVLKPYLDSVTARMDALQDTQNLLTLFVNTINKVFFRDKEIRLHVQDGLSIETDENHKLEPEMLSSGEKHLLLLFCNTLTARDKATIFIIDEPEISLNIKWQRQLIRTLLDFTKGSQVQFLLATHSFELLSQYRSNVVKLENQGY
jgi:ABC-type glutathione transport system ATPase component